MLTINDLMAALGKGKINAIHAADLARLLKSVSDYNFITL